MARNKYPEETVTLILDTAQKLFLEKGYEHTTIQDIIDNLGGLTKGAIYHHFTSKEDILNAVTARLFQENSLARKWNKIAEDTSLNGAQKLKAMLYESLVDEQEQKFRSMGIHLQNMPHMLSDLLLRAVNDIAPNAIKPVLEEGITDGSIKVPFAKELAEIISLLANVWLNPLVFSMSDEDIEKKCQVILEMMTILGVDVSDMYPMVYNMNKQINEMDNRNDRLPPRWQFIKAAYIPKV